MERATDLCTRAVIVTRGVGAQFIGHCSGWEERVTPLYSERSKATNQASLKWNAEDRIRDERVSLVAHNRLLVALSLCGIRPLCQTDSLMYIVPCNLSKDFKCHIESSLVSWSEATFFVKGQVDLIPGDIVKICYLKALCTCGRIRLVLLVLFVEYSFFSCLELNAQSTQKLVRVSM